MASNTRVHEVLIDPMFAAETVCCIHNTRSIPCRSTCRYYLTNRVQDRHVENNALFLAAIDVLDWQWRKRTGHGLHNYHRSFDSTQH
jgi:hypothetical protein